MTRRFRRPLVGVMVAGASAMALATPAWQGHANTTSTAFNVGVPTVVDPIRAAGEPDIAVDDNNNSLITGPAGTGAQTSWFWRTGDGGQTFHLLGPSGGHYVCAGSGGGDSLAVMDRPTNSIYITDQEALASLGMSRLDGNTNQLASNQCANAPGIGADRPFQAVIPSGNTTAVQSKLDNGKPIVYLSWACQACGGTGSGSGLAFGWSDDGQTWHPADPGVADGNLAQQSFAEGNTLSGLEWHGNMVADPTTGDVFTAISCNSGGCPDGTGRNEIGAAVGVPGGTPTLGSFASVSYNPACVAEVGCNQEGSLFPVIGMDSNHTLYEFWNEGNGFASSIAPGDTESWHEYYAYSVDSPTNPDPLHTHWSAPIRVDTGVATAVYGWMAVGDPGKLGFIFLGNDQRLHPSTPLSSTPGPSTATRPWDVYMAITTDATSATPTFQQVQVGRGPNHLKDICLQGTVGCIQTVGNRNMADFISVDIGPDGALQGTWASDANLLATAPTTLIPGLPITETAVQTSGPQLIGSGDVNDPRFSSVPTTAGVSDQSGDAVYPVDQGTTSYPGLDLTQSQVTYDGTNVVVKMTVKDASSLASPDLVNQKNVWWLTSWQYNSKIYYAKVLALPGASAATSAGGPAVITCTAGSPSSYDRPGLNAQTVATLANYQTGTPETGCALSGNTFTITVPGTDVGSPHSGDILESTASYTMLDNGAPPEIGPGTGNIPTIVDATPAYDALLSGPASNVPETPLVPALILLGAAALGATALRRRRATA